MAPMDEDLEIDAPPVDIDPYVTLSVAKDATADQIKTAYRKAALKHHPDKAGPSESEKAAAHTKFQEVAFAYAILSDERRRRRFDTTGRTEETLDLEDDDFDWMSFYREQFRELVTVEKIEEFAQGYKGGEEEKRDLLKVYTKHKGNMVKVYQEVMLSDPADDEERFRDIINQAIEDGEVEAFEKFTGEKEKVWRNRIEVARKKREEEKGEVEELEREIKSKGKNKKKKGGGADAGMGDLAAMIQKRQQGRSEDFFANLEAKYGGKKGSKRSAAEEPSEEAFAANRKRGKGK